MIEKVTTKKERNMLYSAKVYEGFFQYKVNALLRPFCWLLGIKQSIETPINIVLGYRRRSFLFAFTLLDLTVHKYQYGRSSPNPFCHPPILFLGRKYPLLSHLISVIDDDIIASKYGLNIGLMFVSTDELNNYHLMKSEHFEALGQAKTELCETRHISLSNSSILTQSPGAMTIQKNDN